VAELVLEDILQFTQLLLKGLHGWRRTSSDDQLDTVLLYNLLINTVAELVLVEVLHFDQLLLQSLN